MLALLEAFLQIVLRRRGPEDLPDSRFLLGLTLAAYVLAQLPVAGIIFGPTATAAAAIAVDCALLSGVFWALLRFTGHAPRYRQTLTALAGTGALLALAQAPLVYLTKLAGAAGQTAAGPSLGLLALLLWSIIVQAHIAARALSGGYGVGLAVALVYFILSYEVSGMFAPPSG
ncbi:hypothetical protein GPROT2_01094 [Gammaproteobacteria bacterium]|nr:hypothetical protein [Gammaproteobacteria bacterium]QOJ30764.1 MAG: hypothetical protein HRU81_00785 [Gammaproteobacteria bacterium]CAG0940811.1 hypothetical protein GPROT2_01094 [Gammaproteobacteria bacterium]